MENVRSVPYKGPDGTFDGLTEKGDCESKSRMWMSGFFRERDLLLPEIIEPSGYCRSANVD